MALKEIDSLMSGEWKLDRSEHFEDFLKEVGVNVILRKLAGSAKPTQTITVEDDAIKLVLHTGFWDQTTKFKLDENFEMQTQGIDFKCIAKWEDKKLTLEQEPKDTKYKAQRVVREVIDGEMVTTIYIADVICKRVFKRLK